MLARNPAVKARPPTAREADGKAPEMHPWDAGQLHRFPDWARDHSHLHAAWYVAAYTSVRRGELLALRWRDVDLDAGTISVRRSVGIVRVKGRKGVLREGPTKTCRPRVVDIDPAIVAVLRGWKRERGAMALALARDDSVVFGNPEGGFRQPERVSHLFRQQQARCARMLGEDAPPGIRPARLCRHLPYADVGQECLFSGGERPEDVGVTTMSSVIVSPFFRKRGRTMARPAGRISNVVMPGPLAPFAERYRLELLARGVGVGITAVSSSRSASA